MYLVYHRVMNMWMYFVAWNMQSKDNFPVDRWPCRMGAFRDGRNMRNVVQLGPCHRCGGPGEPHCGEKEGLAWAACSLDVMNVPWVPWWRYFCWCTKIAVHIIILNGKETTCSFSIAMSCWIISRYIQLLRYNCKMCCFKYLIMYPMLEKKTPH